MCENVLVGQHWGVGGGGERWTMRTAAMFEGGGGGF